MRIWTTYDWSFPEIFTFSEVYAWKSGSTREYASCTVNPENRSHERRRILPVDHNFRICNRARYKRISPIETTRNHLIHICGLVIHETDFGSSINYTLSILKLMLIGFLSRSTFPKHAELFARAKTAGSIPSTRSPSTRPERLDNPPSTDARSERILTIV
jgi:hypothetical protein